MLSYIMLKWFMRGSEEKENYVTKYKGKLLSAKILLMYKLKILHY